MKMKREDSVPDVLRSAKGLIIDPDRWCQGAMVNGDKICALEALCRADPCFDMFAATNAYDYLCKAMKVDKDVGGFNDSVGGFNDSHSHDEVLDAFDRAIKLAEEG